MVVAPPVTALPRIPAGSRDRGAAATAYARHLVIQAAAPAEDRTYLIVHPHSGLGNKIHVLTSALLMAIVTNRTLLLSKLSDPILPGLVDPGWRPLQPAEVGLLRNNKFSKYVPIASTGRYGFPQFQGVSKQTNARYACLATLHSMGACYDDPPPAVPPRVIELLSNHDACRHWFDEEGALRPGREGAALTAALGFAPTLHEWHVLATRALFAAPGEKVATVVAKMQAAVGWGNASSHGLSRVGVHVRLFVDVSTRKTHRVSAAFWACAVATIEAAQAANPAPPGSPPLIIFFATDMLKSRKYARKYLSHLGRVVYADHTKFTHTAAGSVEQAMAGLVDWYLLAETDVVIGTAGSTFASTAAGLRGAPLVTGDPSSNRPVCRGVEKWS